MLYILMYLLSVVAMLAWGRRILHQINKAMQGGSDLDDSPQN